MWPPSCSILLAINLDSCRRKYVNWKNRLINYNGNFDTIEQQAQELAKKAEEELDQQFKGNPVYKQLKRAYKRINKAIDKAAEVAGEAAAKAAEEIPDFNLNCTG